MYGCAYHSSSKVIFGGTVGGLEAVKTARKNHRGRDGGRGASAEWSQTDCQPCVSLV